MRRITWVAARHKTIFLAQAKIRQSLLRQVRAVLRIMRNSNRTLQLTPGTYGANNAASTFKTAVCVPIEIVPNRFTSRDLSSDLI